MKTRTLKGFRATVFLLLYATTTTSQNTILPKKGYSPQIGTVVEMLEDLKSRVTRSFQNLNQREIDFFIR